MSSKAQLQNYNKRLHNELNHKESIIKNMLLTINNDTRLIKNRDKSILELEDKVRILNQALKKSKRWYQIIIRL